jgi:lysophospholipase L1-like esterase
MRIVCFGDSVTRGISYVQGRLRIVKDNYPALLQNAISIFNPVQVLNKGVFNDNSSLLVDRLEKDVLAEQPSYVLIQIGGNDCNFHWDEVALCPNQTHEPFVPIQTYQENIENMIVRIRNTGAIPVIMSLIPLDPVRYYRKLAEIHGPSIAHWIAVCGGIEYWHAKYNAALEPIIRKLNVLTIDVRRSFLQSADMTKIISDDGIHPTTEGYFLLAAAIRDWFRPLLSMTQPNLS